MSKSRLLFIFGVLIAVLPYLGFPLLWKNILFSIFGLGLALFAYIMNRESKIKKNKESFENFSENSNFK